MASKDSKLKNISVVSDHDTSSGDDDKKETRVDISFDKLNLGRKKKLLVIPLAGILVHRAYRFKPTTIPTHRSPDFSYGKFLVYKRPFCEGFLKFCFERFQVGLWSSALEHNIEVVLNKVMGELKSKLLFTWDQKECTHTGFVCLDNPNKPLFLKELKYLWQKKYSNLPWRHGEYSSSNTLLITTPMKALLNPPNTSISIDDYDPNNKEDDFLGPDGALRAFLDGLVEAEDVPTYVRNHPFGEPAITPSHSDWDYYNTVIRSMGKKKTTDRKN
ncbi:uncharacterized FCP1 homology domain-containing protein C1271.03c-like [Cynara cardunculus var. scolymus]|uniref:uncharacterized FCP1 homology domain-containing protein C1271.03c-like n=1 Tax=Cynara cardunculus var. scolymus TaxID=59895 RepID=UPI000D62A386|nr:uncharacterized FCP1 homology domain-containing protein C1271.03c-like [Cynara cardunculus var. scolymus]